MEKSQVTCWVRKWKLFGQVLTAALNKSSECKCYFGFLIMSPVNPTMHMCHCVNVSFLLIHMFGLIHFEVLHLLKKYMVCT
jgi:hypothetical protein